MCSGRSATSSRNSVPPSAEGIRPTLSATAPVKLPRLWPKNSLSMSSEGIAPQFTGTNGPSARGPEAWIMRATSSLPVPDSPEMCTGAWLRDTRRIISRRRSIAGALPMSCVPVRVDTLASDACESLQRRRDDAPQDAEVQRLGHEIEGAELERAHRGFDVAVRGDDRAGHARAVALSSTRAGRGRRHPAAACR